MSEENRPPIPEPMKREVRQRCAFGCVICGLPIYQYDHMTDYSVVLRHDADNLTLLCAQCHLKKTKGLLTEAQVRARDAAPYNRGRSMSAAEVLHFEGESYNFIIGPISISDCWGGQRCVLLAIDQVPIVQISFIGRQLFFDIDIRDTDGKPLLKIRENELAHSVAEIWDVQFVGKYLTMHAAPRNICLELYFGTPDRIAITRARLPFKAGLFEVNGIDAHFVIGGQIRKLGHTTIQCGAGDVIFGIGAPPPGMSGFWTPLGDYW